MRIPRKCTGESQFLNQIYQNKFHLFLKLISYAIQYCLAAILKLKHGNNNTAE